MDKISKALKKLTDKEREEIKFILLKLNRGETKGFDIKKLKGRNDIFRIRRRNIRIIYKIYKKQIYLLVIERRNENTYKSF
ncbi:type II toxin-antitoxin system RelE/ParE family toxin [Candidatus Wolfebacteria bacterium]|nr:type II toxin-antitoxin system RelE/ParE family toxin [Candidatus Wolfebacteria bacterium]